MSLASRLMTMFHPQPAGGGGLHHGQTDRRAHHPQAPTGRGEFAGYHLPAALRVYHSILLPPQQGPPRPTLVLDLDRTLIDCITVRQPSETEPDFLYTDTAGMQAKVWTRPFLYEFLSAVAQDFEVVLFTAAGPRHADSVLSVIDPDRSVFSHRLYGQHTSECKQWAFAKDLSRLGRPLSQCLLVDDSQLAGLLQPCNLVPIRPFMYSDPYKHRDTALRELLTFLQDKVLHADDVRHAIAEHWNKVTRRPRKQPLGLKSPGGAPYGHPIIHAPPSPSTSPRSSAHTPRPLAQYASVPHPEFHDLSRRFSHDCRLTSVISESPGMGGGARLHATPVRASVDGAHVCAAAREGCGCHYSSHDQAAEMVMALHAMQLHDDHEDCEEFDGAQAVSCTAVLVQPHMRRSPADCHLSDRCPSSESGGAGGVCGDCSTVSPFSAQRQCAAQEPVTPVLCAPLGPDTPLSHGARTVQYSALRSMSSELSGVASDAEVSSPALGNGDTSDTASSCDESLLVAVTRLDSDASQRDTPRKPEPATACAAVTEQQLCS